MSSTWSTLGTVMVLSANAGGAAPQAAAEATSAKVWLGRATEYEEFLKGAAVARMEDIPVGVTKPIRCYFAPGGLVESVAFKSIPPGRQTGYWESYKSEMAAYELDELLWERMLALDAAALKPILGPYLDGGQIKDIIQRRDRMKTEIEKMVAQSGEANVFFP